MSLKTNIHSCIFIHFIHYTGLSSICIHVISTKFTEFFNKANFSNLLSYFFAYFYAKTLWTSQKSGNFIISLFSIEQIWCNIFLSSVLCWYFAPWSGSGSKSKKPKSCESNGSGSLALVLRIHLTLMRIRIMDPHWKKNGSGSELESGCRSWTFLWDLLNF